MWCLLLIGAVLLVLAVQILHWLQARAIIPALHKRYVLVTGCDTGFGRRLALRLDKMGCHVFAACLTSSGAKELSSETSERVKTIMMDVTKDEDIERAVKEVQDALPDNKGLWAIVNNAGIMGGTGVSEMLTRKHFLQTLQINVMGMAEVTRMFLPLVRQERGRVVNTTSVVGRFAMGPAPYVTSKFAAVGYTDVLRRELYHHGITVHAIMPGGYDTNLLDKDIIQNSMTQNFNAASPHVQRVYGADYVKNTMEAFDMVKRFVTATNPEEVVDAYIHALTSKRPSTYYVVGLNGKFFYRPLWMMPTWLADWIITRGVKPPADV